MHGSLAMYFRGMVSQFECLVLNGIGVVLIKLKVWDRLP